ncbi:helix-turn-helix transcriptional regulator [Streptomyces albiaxialis]|uniref:Helix-turn-helix transcriptional regulator n=1 Tax=Streptomyces albiaxialis TaxID=329523 RepID=A0ABP5HPP9_9ACTN
MTREADPSLNRRRLRIELRKARERSEKTQKDVADALEWSLSKLIRIEAGTVGISITDLRALLQLYGITDPDAVHELEEAARASKGQSWWTQYTDMLNPKVAQLLSYEGAAEEYRCYECVLMPAVLQTSEYTSALLAPFDSPDTPRAIELRATRQERLFDDEAVPKAEFVLAESLLHLQIGGPTVLRKQLDHLLARSEQRDVTLRVLPFSAGAHRSTSRSFILLGFKDDDDLLFMEGAGGTVLTRSDLEMTVWYQECFADISERALSVDESRRRIEQARDALSSS